MNQSSVATRPSPLAPCVDDSLRRLRSYVESRNWSGYDPYDGLNSPILRWAALGLKYPRIAAIQFMKKSPMDLRPLLRVRPGHNPKGLGLFLWGYAKLYRASGDAAALENCGRLIELLKQYRATGYHGNCWGYNFDWQSRAFYVPKGTPTIVNTTFIGHALLDTFEYSGLQQALDMALPIRQFLLNDLFRTREGNDFCFSYTPIDQIAVHNANLLGASLLIRLHHYDAHDEGYEAAHASLRYSMKYQRDDGSWWYAEPDYQHWIDSFHTGFNLQSIQYFLEQGEAAQFQDAYDRGIQFYADKFFLEDGTPKYYHDRTYPIDIHSYAQAIVFFCRQQGKYDDLLERVTGNLIETMQDPRGYFYFQKKPTKTIKIPYMRWTQAWVFHALTEYVLKESGLQRTARKT
jgi:hypothetical protein